MIELKKIQNSKKYYFDKMEDAVKHANSYGTKNYVSDLA
jgi:hypothetical protein